MKLVWIFLACLKVITLGNEIQPTMNNTTKQQMIASRKAAKHTQNTR